MSLRESKPKRNNKKSLKKKDTRRRNSSRAKTVKKDTRRKNSSRRNRSRRNRSRRNRSHSKSKVNQSGGFGLTEFVSSLVVTLVLGLVGWGSIKTFGDLGGKIIEEQRKSGDNFNKMLFEKRNQLVLLEKIKHLSGTVEQEEPVGQEDKPEDKQEDTK